MTFCGEDEDEDEAVIVGDNSGEGNELDEEVDEEVEVEGREKGNESEEEGDVGDTTIGCAGAGAGTVVEMGDK